jgi:hypothetical protein
MIDMSAEQCSPVGAGEGSEHFGGGPRALGAACADAIQGLVEALKVLEPNSWLCGKEVGRALEFPLGPREDIDD